MHQCQELVAVAHRMGEGLMTRIMIQDIVLAVAQIVEGMVVEDRHQVYQVTIWNFFLDLKLIGSYKPFLVFNDINCFVFSS